MRTWTKVFVAAVLAGGMMVGARAQSPIIVAPSAANPNSPQVTLNAQPVTIRSPSNPYGWLINYGDLYLDGGIAGLTYGWLFTNRVIVMSGGRIDINDGNLHINNGSLFLNGSKHFIHPHPTDESKAIRYVAIESGEALTIARGVAKTEGGEAVIELPEHFSMVTSGEAPITVVVTPKGAPVLLYVKEESRDKIVVAMREPDFVEFRDVEFSYQVTGVRDGFEKIEVVTDEDNLDTRDFVRRDVQERIEAFGERARARLEK
jgi:hypothetical protein